MSVEVHGPLTLFRYPRLRTTALSRSPAHVSGENKSGPLPSHATGAPRSASSTGQLKCDGTRAETTFRLSAKRTSPFKSAGGRQFSRLLAAETCASAVVMLDTPCSEVLWRILATRSIRQFPLHFPSRASPCAITFHLESTWYLLKVKVLPAMLKWGGVPRRMKRSQYLVCCVTVKINLLCKPKLYNSRNYQFLSYYVQPHVLLKIGCFVPMKWFHVDGNLPINIGCIIIKTSSFKRADCSKELTWQREDL